MFLLLLSSCTKIGNYAEKRANKAAYSNIAGAQHSAFGETDIFSIGVKEEELLQQLLEIDRKQEEVQLLSLADTIALAMANSRSYQFEKENLFIQALNLTETQKDFNWDTSASSAAASTGISKQNGNVETFGEQGVDGNLTLGISRTLVSGAKVSLGFTHAFLNAFSSPDTSGEGNAVSLNIVQPLLNGFGPLVAKETLRQAERDMVYAVREFKRYQQGFVINIADQYYSALQTRDQLINQRRNYESAVANREQTESMAKAGRIKEFEAAQAKQSELNAADSLTLAISNYQSALDDFRYTLGIPIDLNVEPDSRELKLLEERGLVQFDIDQQAAMDSALSNRLDLITRRDAVEDNERLLEITRRNFLPDLNANYNVTADPEFDSSDQVDQDLTVSLDIPFDWTEKRNDYRIAQIRLDRAVRSLQAEEDDIRRDVRELWRKLERNRSVYKNRLLSVRLSERRVENTELLLQQGKVQTRDLLDAQDDLLSSRNQATSALVDYTINRLRFWDAIERFEIDPKGMWYEQSEEEITE
ncbi:TolC family protein [Pontiella agarivorans]|uniref:TolC family protein n=1 Tax=Pontiella agarivorans TaxID=3038953 RepID=A0ABU5N1N1_9BACT|nr:TolC family protein [Pontiella agarivorans]MDZ8120355.1 TolC family protein [Pontiella agarivorans]